MSPFSEGWATYSEFQLAAKDLNLLKNDLIQMYGIVRRQVCGKNTSLSFSHFDSLFLKLVKGKVKRKKKNKMYDSVIK